MIEAGLATCYAIIVLAGVAIIYMGGAEAIYENMRENTLKNSIKQH
jgi:hypothetical protein